MIHPHRGNRDPAEPLRKEKGKKEEISVGEVSAWCVNAWSKWRSGRVSEVVWDLGVS